MLLWIYKNKTKQERNIAYELWHFFLHIPVLGCTGHTRKILVVIHV